MIQLPTTDHVNTAIADLEHQLSLATDVNARTSLDASIGVLIELRDALDALTCEGVEALARLDVHVAG